MVAAAQIPITVPTIWQLVSKCPLHTVLFSLLAAAASEFFCLSLAAALVGDQQLVGVCARKHNNGTVGLGIGVPRRGTGEFALPAMAALLPLPSAVIRPVAVLIGLFDAQTCISNCACTPYGLQVSAMRTSRPHNNAVLSEGQQLLHEVRAGATKHANAACTCTWTC